MSATLDFMHKQNARNFQSGDNIKRRLIEQHVVENADRVIDPKETMAIVKDMLLDAEQLVKDIKTLKSELKHGHMDDAADSAQRMLNGNSYRANPDYTFSVARPDCVAMLYTLMQQHGMNKTS